MDITKMTDVEIKALAYDQVKLLNSTQHNLNLIEQELQKRDENKDKQGEE